MDARTMPASKYAKSLTYMDTGIVVLPPIATPGQVWNIG
jgi:hypothetical protein